MPGNQRPSSQGRLQGRRLRIDRSGPGPGPSADAGPVPGRGVSGRRAVVAGVVAISMLWGGLFLAFRHWRAAYRERATQGAARVARAIGPLTEISPPGTTPAAWQRVVVETRAMLLTLTASNLLDRAGVDALGAEIDARVARARARPETALDELAGLWDDLAARAGPVVGRHPRPAPLPPPWPVRRPP